MAKRQSTLDSFFKKKPRLDSDEDEQQQVPTSNVVSDSESECESDMGDSSSEEDEMQEPATACTLSAVNTTTDRPSSSQDQHSFPPAPNDR